MKKKDMDLVKAYQRSVASAGGKARANKLSKARRSAIARAAARKRWGSPNPKRSRKRR